MYRQGLLLWARPDSDSTRSSRSLQVGFLDRPRPNLVLITVSRCRPAFLPGCLPGCLPSFLPSFLPLTARCAARRSSSIRTSPFLPLSPQFAMKVVVVLLQQRAAQAVRTLRLPPPLLQDSNSSSSSSSSYCSNPNPPP